MTLSGCPGPGVRRDERDRRRRSRDVARVRAQVRQRAEPLAVLDDDERPALLVLGAVRPRAGAEDAVEVLGLDRAGPRTRARRAWRGRRPRWSSASLGSALGPARAQVRGSAGARVRRAPASERKPPGSSSRVVRRSGSGRRTAGTASASGRGLVGVSGPAERRGEEPRDRRAVRRELVEPGVAPARDDEGLGDRLGRAARRAPASRPGRPTGTTPSSRAVDEHHRGVDLADGARSRSRTRSCGRAAAGRRGS